MRQSRAFPLPGNYSELRALQFAVIAYLHVHVCNPPAAVFDLHDIYATYSKFSHFLLNIYCAKTPCSFGDSLLFNINQLEQHNTQPTKQPTIIKTNNNNKQQPQIFSLCTTSHELRHLFADYCGPLFLPTYDCAPHHCTIQQQRSP